MFVFFLGMAYLAWSIFIYSPEIDELKSHLTIRGKSMEPTFHDGQLVRYSAGAIPKVGDVISFDCLVDKCLRQTVAHRLISIEPNGCMNIEGDNQPTSFDTKDYGCLMPDEIAIKGVATNQ